MFVPGIYVRDVRCLTSSSTYAAMPNALSACSPWRGIQNISSEPRAPHRAPDTARLSADTPENARGRVLAALGGGGVHHRGRSPQRTPTGYGCNRRERVKEQRRLSAYGITPPLVEVVVGVVVVVVGVVVLVVGAGAVVVLGAGVVGAAAGVEPELPGAPAAWVLPGSALPPPRGGSCGSSSSRPSTSSSSA